jgi:hypothetical protein
MSDDNSDDIDDWSFEEDYIDDDPDGVDADPEPDATPDADPQPGLLTRTADGIGRGVGMLIFGTLGGIGRVGHTTMKAGFATVDSLLPFSGRMYQSLAEWSVSRLYQQSGGDAVGLIVNDDLSLDLEVAKLCETEVDNDGVKAGGWRTRSRERSWAETAQGRDIARLGKAPIVVLPEPSTRRVAPIEAQVERAITTGNWQHVFRVEQPGAVELNVDIDAAQGSPSDAVADGGYDAWLRDVKHGVLEDTLVDISDPQRVSFNSVVDTYREESDAERLDEQQRLGFEAGRLGEDDRDVIAQVIKLLLVVGLLLAIVTIGPKLLGGGGGAGISDVAPLMVGLI